MSDASERKIPGAVRSLPPPPAIPAKSSAPPDSSGRVWSDQQQAIFEEFKSGRGHVIVRARAGTGKTTTIIEALKLAPERTVLLAAFNKIIANELKARCPGYVDARTLHSLGYGYIMQHWRGVSVDEQRGYELAVAAFGKTEPRPVVTLIKNLHTKLREVWPHETDPLAVADLAVRFDLLPEVEDERKYPLEKVCAWAMAARNLALQESEVIDFADMVFLPLAMGWVRPKYDLVVVDEAQDMTEPQLEMAMRACNPGGRIIIVGDDRQAIYAFRGADSDCLNRLKQTLGAKELGLTTTYRCGKAIVTRAQQLVPDFSAPESAHEGEVIESSSEDCIKNASVGDFILSRLNAPLVGVCLGLLLRGVRARIRGRDIGKQILTLIKKWDVDTIDEAIDRLDEWQKREAMRAARLPEEVRGRRFRFIEEQYNLIHSLMEGVATMSAFKDRVELLFADEAGAQVVMCSSVHKAKGLEAERVWLLKETFKHGTLEEENIQYVAITRAKRSLNWVRPNEGGGT